MGVEKHGSHNTEPVMRKVAKIVSIKADICGVEFPNIPGKKSELKCFFSSLISFSFLYFHPPRSILCKLNLFMAMR